MMITNNDHAGDLIHRALQMGLEAFSSITKSNHPSFTQIKVKGNEFGVSNKLRILLRAELLGKFPGKIMLALGEEELSLLTSKVKLLSDEMADYLIECANITFSKIATHLSDETHQITLSDVPRMFDWTKELQSEFHAPPDNAITATFACLRGDEISLLFTIRFTDSREIFDKKIKRAFRQNGEGSSPRLNGLHRVKKLPKRLAVSAELNIFQSPNIFKITLCFDLRNQGLCIAQL